MTDDMDSLPDGADVYDVCQAFDRALDAAPDDRALLRRWTDRFPYFADELIAVGYARAALGLTLTDPAAEAEWEGAPARPPAASPPIAGLVAEAGGRGLDVAALARTLRLSRLLLSRLETRTVRPGTIPRSLVRRLGEALGRPFEEVAAYLRGAPRLAAQAHFKARRAPALVAESGAARPDFADEIGRDATLTEEDRAYWRAEIAEGTLGDEWQEP